MLSQDMINLGFLGGGGLIGWYLKIMWDAIKDLQKDMRDIESEVLDDLSQRAHGVLSTGGGSVLRPLNRERLKSRGQVFYLRSSPEEVFRRLRHDQNRPLLQVADPLRRLRDLFDIRDPLYRETAHHVIETGRPTVAALVNMILDKLDAKRSGSSDAPVTSSSSFASDKPHVSP